MAWDALTTGEIAIGEPIDNPLMIKIKDNLDFLYGQIGSGGGGVSGVANGSFEVDADSNDEPDDWDINEYTGGSSVYDLTTPAHGAKAWKFTHPGGGGNGGGYADSDYIEVSEDIPYTISFLLKASTAGMKNKVEIREYDKAKSYQSTQTLYDSTSNPTSWTLFHYQFTPASSINYVKIRLIGGYTDTDVAGDIFWDGITIFPAITPARLKMTQGSWSQSILSGDFASINMVEYSHYPAMKGSSTDTVGVFKDRADNDAPMLPSSYAFHMWAHSPSGSRTWYGQYYYHASSEQIIEVYKNLAGDVIGIHVTEKGNEKSMKFLSGGVELSVTRKVFSVGTNPELFFVKQKQVKYSAESIEKTQSLMDIVKI